MFKPQLKTRLSIFAILNLSTVKTKNPHIDIILPCFNPIPGWEKKVFESYQKISNSFFLGKTVHIILVNDGSTIAIHKEIDFLKKQIESFTYVQIEKNTGKGYAIREGGKHSNAHITFFSDIDFPYEEENLWDMYQKIERENADIVIGIRDEAYYATIPKGRKWVSNLFKKMVKILFKVPTSDTQAGLKAFSEKGKNVLLNTKINRYLFDLELVKKASNKEDIKMGYTSLSLKKETELAPLSLKILIRESKNLIRIFWM